MLFRLLVGVAAALVAGILIATTALADLRSPEGTVELGAKLADDPAVRALVASTVVDTLVEDASTSSRDVALFLPLLRPLLVSAVDAALDAPAGRAALAATLTDAARQLTFDGPIVLDLRDAVLAAADAAPEPLATLARTAVERGAVGIVVLGDAGDVVDGGAREVPDDASLARVGGLAASTATALAWTLLGIVLLAATVPDGATRPARLRATGGALLLVGAPTALLLRLAPDQVVDRVAVRLQDTAAGGATGGSAAGGGASGGSELLVAVLPSLADGVTGLLGRTSVVAIGVAGAGVVLLAAGVALRAAPGRR